MTPHVEELIWAIYAKHDTKFENSCVTVLYQSDSASSIQKHYCSLKKTLLHVPDARTKLQLKVKCINCRSISGVHIKCSILDITCTDGKRLHYYKSENKHRRCYKAHCLLNIFHCYDSYHVHLGGLGEFKQMQCIGSQRNSVRASRHQKVLCFPAYTCTSMSLPRIRSDVVCI